jgi:PAS domain S-box-containing protein
MVKTAHADRRRMESESTFRPLAEGTADRALYVLDPFALETNRNAGDPRIKDYTSDELIGQHLSKFYVDEDRSNKRALLALEAAEKSGRDEEEGRRVPKDGSVFSTSVTMKTVQHQITKSKKTHALTRFTIRLPRGPPVRKSRAEMAIPPGAGRRSWSKTIRTSPRIARTASNSVRWACRSTPPRFMRLGVITHSLGRPTCFNPPGLPNASNS